MSTLDSQNSLSLRLRKKVFSFRYKSTCNSLRIFRKHILLLKTLHWTIYGPKKPKSIKTEDVSWHYSLVFCITTSCISSIKLAVEISHWNKLNLESVIAYWQQIADRVALKTSMHFFENKLLFLQNCWLQLLCKDPKRSINDDSFDKNTGIETFLNQKCQKGQLGLVFIKNHTSSSPRLEAAFFPSKCRSTLHVSGYLIVKILVSFPAVKKWLSKDIEKCVRFVAISKFKKTVCISSIEVSVNNFFFVGVDSIWIAWVFDLSKKTRGRNCQKL